MSFSSSGTSSFCSRVKGETCCRWKLFYSLLDLFLFYLLDYSNVISLVLIFAFHNKLYIQSQRVGSRTLVLVAFSLGLRFESPWVQGLLDKCGNTN